VSFSRRTRVFTRRRTAAEEAKDHAAQHEHADKDNVGKRLSAAILQVPKDIKEALSPMMKRRGSATSARKESKPDAGEQPHE
jgi:hypothetical protein